MPECFRTAIAAAFACLLTGCAVGAPRTDIVGTRMVNIQRWRSGNDYVNLHYPRVVGTAAARLNPVIERWIGGHCLIVGPKSQHYDDAAACVVAFVDTCARLRAADASNRTFGCTLDAKATVVVNAAGILGLTMTSYAYTSGAHGLTNIADLNLDLRSGRVLGLNDFLDHSVPKRLSTLLERGLRRVRHISRDQSLKQAGYFNDNLPVPDTVLALPEGLRFTYQSDDIGPRTMGQPQALVPYAALSGFVRSNGALSRLHQLLRQDIP